MRDVTVAGSAGGEDEPWLRRFGFCPKISTPVENTVEKPPIQDKVTPKR
jgi:hypothetical protein